MAREDALWIDKYPNSAAIVMADEDGNKFRFVAENGELFVSKNGTTGQVLSGSSGTVEVADDVLLTLGSDNDQVLVNRSSSLAADTALTGVIVGTPEVAAIPANSLVVANVTADGDLVFVGQTGGNSTEAFRYDASAKLVVVNEDSDDVDFRVETDGNANALVIDGGTNSAAVGSAVVAGAALSVANTVSRDVVTAVGVQLHIPATSFTDSGATGTIAALHTAVVGAKTIVATNTITYTDAASLKVNIPIASTGATFTRTYAIWANGQIRADSNFQVNNTATFASTQPTGAVVFQNRTAPAGAITTGGAIFTDGTTMKKIIADGTVSDIQT